MQKNTRLKFDKLAEDIAKTYGIKDVAKTFAATPTIEQTLSDKIVEQSDFLQRINVMGVDELKG